jgi:hypothetical protein
MHWKKLDLLCGAALCSITTAITNTAHEQNIVQGAYIVELNGDYVCLKTVIVGLC